MPLPRGRSVRFGGLLHRDSIEAGSFGSRPRLLSVVLEGIIGSADVDVVLTLLAQED